MPKELTRSRCNRCGNETNHRVLFNRQIDGYEEDDEGDILFSYWDRYELLACAGCDSVSLRHTDFFEPHNEETVAFYPPRTSRNKPRWLQELSPGMREVLKEVYAALDSDSLVLALMGARAVLDMLFVEKVGDVGGFGAKLKELERKGYVGAKNREILETALDAGNAAAHRGYRPKPDDLTAVMDILENLLQAVYHLESLAERLKGTTPPRTNAGT